MPEQGGNALQRGVESGTTMFSNLLGRGLQQAQMRQAWQQHLHNLEIQRQQQARLAEELALAKELHPFHMRALERTEQNAPLELELLQAKINAQNQLATQRSPEYLQKQYEALNRVFGAQAGNKTTAPSQDMIMRGLMKKQLGFDPFAPSEEQKKENRLNEFREKQAIKQESKKAQDLTEITPATRTKYQSIVREVNSIMPVMNELVEEGGENVTHFKTAKDLKYLGKVKRIADVYMKAKGWPNTDTARKDAIELFKKGAFESDDDYQNRMQELADELIYERDLSLNALQGGKTEAQESPYEVSEKNKKKLNTKVLTYNPMTGKVE